MGDLFQAKSMAWFSNAYLPDAGRCAAGVAVTTGGKMSTPTGDNAFLYKLELSVKEELTVAETSQPEEQAGVAGDEWPPDPDAQRYEVALRTLLGAVEALEDASGPGGHPPSA